MFSQLALCAALLACSLPAQQPDALSADAREVLDLEKKIGVAVVQGDTAFFDHVASPDFVMTHSDHWTTGGKPLLVDDKKSFLKRIENRSYLSYDLDSVRIEMHGDVAITYGRSSVLRQARFSGTMKDRRTLRTAVSRRAHGLCRCPTPSLPECTKDKKMTTPCETT